MKAGEYESDKQQAADRRGVPWESDLRFATPQNSVRHSYGIIKHKGKSERLTDKA